jgi:predicted nucleic-acid-binding protein
VFENRAALHHFLAEARDINADLSYLLIVRSAQAAGAEEVLTFDRKAPLVQTFSQLNSTHVKTPTATFSD